MLRFAQSSSWSGRLSSGCAIRLRRRPERSTPILVRRTGTELAEDTQPAPPDGAARHDVEALREQLSNAIAMSAKQDQIVWAVFGVFWAAGAVLLVALFTTGNAPSRSVGLVVSIAGTVLSFIWAIIQYRALGYLHFYDSVVQEIESRLHLPADVALSGRIFTAPTSRGYL